MKIYAISDTHFGHERLTTVYGRNEGFTETILKNLSQLHGDMLIHCGDFCIGKDEHWHELFMNATKGFKKKILVRGNHDHQSNNWYYSHGWDFVCELYLVKLFGKQLLFTHMPMLRNDSCWRPHFPPDRNIHGHLHGTNERAERKVELYDHSFHYDLAPDIRGYTAVKVEDIVKEDPT
jgi:calcineurin-like phosphoesterase family protein